jgi:hypothetical protein
MVASSLTSKDFKSSGRPRRATRWLIVIRTTISHPPDCLGHPCWRRLGALGQDEHPWNCWGWRGWTRRGELEARWRQGQCDTAQSLIVVRSNPMAISQCASNKTHDSVSNLTLKQSLQFASSSYWRWRLLRVAVVAHERGSGAWAWWRRCTSLVAMCGLGGDCARAWRQRRMGLAMVAAVEHGRPVVPCP